MRKSQRGVFAPTLALMLCAAVGFFALQSCRIKPPVDLAKAKWLVLGPFFSDPSLGPWVESKGFFYDYLSAIGGESGSRLEEGQIFEGRTVTANWAENGAVDLLQLFPGATNSLAYAYLEIKSPNERKVALKLGSDDGARVWLNGKLLWSNHVFRSLNPDEDAVALPLQKGVNRLLLKIDQGGGSWGFSARLRSLEDEERDWAAQKSRRLSILTPDVVLKTEGLPTEGWFVVSTTPSFIIDAEAEVTASDTAGQVLCAAEGRIGEPIRIELPRNYSGILRLRASGKGKRADIGSGAAIAFAGNGAESIGDMVENARAAGSRVKSPENSEDVGATLTFLSDQLERKVHSSLVTTERNIRAVDAVMEILESLRKGPWQPASMRGLRQWAYRSAIDDSCQPYTAYVPETYDPAKRYPLIVTLHGFSADDYQSAKKLADLNPEDYIIVGAFGRGDMGYRSMGEQDVLDVTDRIQRIYSIDQDRVYLMGNSMGGMGTWRLGQLFADRFAAIAPFCGWTGTEYLENLRNLPVLIVHGDADTDISIDMDREAAARLKQLGFTARFDVLPGAGHGAWEAWAKKNGGDRIFEFFGKYKRNPWPGDVTLVTGNYLRYGAAYWLRVNELSGPRSRTQAAVKGPREIQVTCEGVSALSLDLRHPGLEQAGEVKVTVNGSPLSAPAGKTARIASQDGTEWVMEKPTSPQKTPRLGGGLADLFHGPVVFVYGTTRPDRRAVLKKAAEQFADMSATDEIPMGSKVGRIPVLSDKDIPFNALSRRHLFLFGNAEENLITRAFMARWAWTLPVHLDGNDVSVLDRVFKKSGLFLTYPNPLASGRLVTIASLPFSAKEVEAFTRIANVPLRGYKTGAGGVDCMTYPDVMVLNSLREGVTDAWIFNSDWTKLLPFPVK